MLCSTRDVALMSLRPMLFASRIEPLISVANSRDVSLVPKIVEWFRTNLRNPEPSTIHMVEREADRLLSGKIEGQPESEDHVHMISALAEILGVQRTASMIADGDWKQGAWDAYFDGIKVFIDPGTFTRFGQLVQCKRPLFGSSIDTSWSYYGYLFHEEARQLLEGLSSAAASHPEIASGSFIDGFHNEITGWLQQVLDRRSDLWLFAS